MHISSKKKDLFFNVLQKGWTLCVEVKMVGLKAFLGKLENVWQIRKECRDKRLTDGTLSWVLCQRATIKISNILRCFLTSVLNLSGYWNSFRNWSICCLSEKRLLSINCFCSGQTETILGTTEFILVSLFYFIYYSHLYLNWMQLFSLWINSVSNTSWYYQGN